MKTLNNVLKFIKLMNVSTRKFEADAGLPNGTIGGAERRKAELSPEVIHTIVEKYSTDLSAKGFEIIDLSDFGKGEAILSKEEMPKVDGYVSPNETEVKPKFIELKTASGKVLNVKPEGATEIDLLNAFLEERDRVIDSKQERIFELTKDKEDLLTLLNSKLGDISKIQKAIFAMVRTGLEYEAALASRGDKTREAEMLSSLTKLNHKNLKVDAVTEKAVVLSK